MCTLVLIAVNLHIKFEVPNFTCSIDMLETPKFINRSRDPDQAHLGVVFHPKANT